MNGINKLISKKIFYTITAETYVAAVGTWGKRKHLMSGGKKKTHFCDISPKVIARSRKTLRDLAITFYF